MWTEEKPALHPESAATEMSARRTGMSFQRTRLSADRTLMSVIRTSLSLIGFGFTIVQFFAHLRETGTFKVQPGAPTNFGLTLVALGVCLLVIGIVYHRRFMRGLRTVRHEMKAQGLIYGESGFSCLLHDGGRRVAAAAGRHGICEHVAWHRAVQVTGAHRVG